MKTPKKQISNYLLVILMNFLVLNFSIAQSGVNTKKLTSAKEVVERYRQAIGLNEHSNDFVYHSKQETSVVHTTTIYGGEKIESTSKNIEFVDYVKEEIASIRAFPINGRLSIARYLNTKETSYMFMDNGNTAEHPQVLTYDSFVQFPKAQESDDNDDTLLPNEIFDGEDAYVILSSVTLKLGDIDQTTQIHRYYSVETGLLIGIKTNSKSTMVTDIGGGDIPMEIFTTGNSITYLKDYRKVGNILLPHKEIQITEIEQSGDVTSSTKMNVSKMIDYNVDPEHFKNVIFKNPKKAIAEIPDEL